jgi:hypothetical protein
VRHPYASAFGQPGSDRYDRGSGWPKAAGRQRGLLWALQAAAEVSEDESGEGLAEGEDVGVCEGTHLAKVVFEEGEAVFVLEVAALDAVPVSLTGLLESGDLEEAEDGEGRGVEFGGDAEAVAGREVVGRWAVGFAGRGEGAVHRSQV